MLMGREDEPVWVCVCVCTRKYPRAHVCVCVCVLGEGAMVSMITVVVILVIPVHSIRIYIAGCVCLAGCPTRGSCVRLVWQKLQR